MQLVVSAPHNFTRDEPGLHADQFLPAALRGAELENTGMRAYFPKQACISTYSSATCKQHVASVLGTMCPPWTTGCFYLLIPNNDHTTFVYILFLTSGCVICTLAYSPGFRGVMKCVYWRTLLKVFSVAMQWYPSENHALMQRHLREWRSPQLTATFQPCPCVQRFSQSLWWALNFEIPRIIQLLLESILWTG